MPVEPMVILFIFQKQSSTAHGLILTFQRGCLSEKALHERPTNYKSF